MRRGGWLLLIVLLGALSVRAQDNAPVYRLREPSVDEFMGSIPEVWQRWVEQLPKQYGKSPDQPVVFAIQSEMVWRYTHDEVFSLNAQTLAEAYETLRGSLFGGNDYPGFDDVIWLNGILEAGIRESSVDLQAQEIDVPGFGTYPFLPVDLDGDAIPELLIDSIYSGGYVSRAVLKADTETEAGYYIIPSSLGWYYLYAPPGMIALDKLVTLRIEDLNQDQLPEWVVLNDYGPWGCSDMSIVSWDKEWRDGMITLLQSGGHYCSSGEITIANLDDDPFTEIEIVSTDGDNWSCTWTFTERLKWDGEYFNRNSFLQTLSQSLGCAMRRAEMLMWANQPAAAIPEYEQGLAWGWPDPIPESSLPYRRAIEAYAQTRLALAYALTNRWNKAQDLLRDLQQKPLDIAIEQMVKAMLEAEQTPLSMCAAAFNVWDEIDRTHNPYPFDLIPAVIGRTSTHPIVVGSNEPPDPALAGCNIPLMLDALLSGEVFDTGRSPVDQLAELGINIRHEESFDLNGDGTLEWLVWPEAHVPPYLLVSQGDQYILSKTTLRQPNQYTHVATQQLPNGEIALVDWILLDFDPVHIDQGYYEFNTTANCFFEDEVEAGGSIKLHRLNGIHLEQFFLAPICIPRAFESLFSPDAEFLYAAYYDWNTSTDQQDVIYQWDADQRTYVHPASDPTPVPTSIPGDVNPSLALNLSAYSDAELFTVLAAARNAFEKRHYQAALVILEDGLDHRHPDALPILVNGVRYWRALALEALDRPDDALAEYVAIYAAAPESAWGHLARLHFDCVANCAE